MVTIKHPPQPTIDRISQLIARIQAGDIKIPKFQRGFIWKNSQILDLLSSIYEGYPIGSLLFWLTEEKMHSEKDVSGFDLPKTPEKYPRNYVLDGQQRLTTIYGVLNWPRPYEPHKLNVHYDLDKKTFYHYAGETNSKSFPLSMVFDTKKVLAFQNELLKSSNDELLNNELINLIDTFKEYLIPVVTITEKTVEDVCPIFERINSTGTQLNMFDLMVAATWRENFDLNESVADIRASAKLKDFEDLNNATFLKLMGRIQGYGAQKRSLFKLRQLSAADLKELSAKVKTCVERAIDFLATDLKVPSAAFLPYENQLIVIAYFYSKVKSPTHEQLKTLRKWFWQTGFKEHFRGAPDALLDRDFNAIDELISNKNNDALMIRLSLVENDLLKRQFVTFSAFSKTFIVMLANNEPRNITNGERIDVALALSNYNKKEFHHLYPKEYLKRLNVDSAKRNNICNICMLASSQNKIVSDRAPREYLRNQISALGNDANLVLRSNMLPNKEDIPLDNYEKFLRERANFLAAEINRLCAY